MKYDLGQLGITQEHHTEIGRVIWCVPGVFRATVDKIPKQCIWVCWLEILDITVLTHQEGTELNKSDLK